MKKILLLTSAGLSIGAMQPPAKAPVKKQVTEKLPLFDQDLQDQLVKAVQNNDTQKVARLLKFRPQVNINAENTDGTRPLEAAVYARHLDMARLLLENGANPNQRITGGLTPGQTLLMYAVSIKKASMVKLLLDHGADASAEFNDNARQGGRPRKAIDFLSGTGPEVEKIRRLLSKGKLL